MEKFRKKQNIYFILIILTLALIILGSVLGFTLVESFDSSIMIFTLVLLIGLFILLYLKGKLDYYTDNYKYQKLVNSRILPFKTKNLLFSNNWYALIKNKGFTPFRSYPDFEVFYKFDHVTYKSRKQKAAVFLIIIKNETLSFDSNKIVKSIHDFEDTYRKKEKFLHHIVLQFKESNSKLSKEQTDETLNINFMTLGKRNHLIVINSYYSSKNSEFIFLYSPNYSPNHYYTYAADTLLDLI